MREGEWSKHQLWTYVLEEASFAAIKYVATLATVGFIQSEGSDRRSLEISHCQDGQPAGAKASLERIVSFRGSLPYLSNHPPDPTPLMTHPSFQRTIPGSCLSIGKAIDLVSELFGYERERERGRASSRSECS